MAIAVTQASTIYMDENISCLLGKLHLKIHKNKNNYYKLQFLSYLIFYIISQKPSYFPYSSAHNPLINRCNLLHNLDSRDHLPNVHGHGGPFQQPASLRPVPLLQPNPGPIRLPAIRPVLDARLLRSQHWFRVGQFGRHLVLQADGSSRFYQLSEVGQM